MVEFQANLAPMTGLFCTLPGPLQGAIVEHASSLHFPLWTHLRESINSARFAGASEGDA